MGCFSDISVLHTLLAQEGLTDDDFAKNEKELKIKKDKKERQRTWEMNLKILKWKHHH